MTDIYAARLDTTGHLIDTTPIVISQAMYNQTAPQVGWNGQSWLVVWMTERQGDRYFNDVVGVAGLAGRRRARPGADRHQSGGDVDQYVLALVRGKRRNELGRRVARPGRVGVGLHDRRRAHLALGRSARSGGKRLRQDSWNSGAVDASLAFAGDEYLMTWLELDSGTGAWVVRGQRLTTALDPVGGVFKINLYAPTSPVKPAVASDGNGFFVSWSEERYAGWAQLFGSRVSHSGMVLDPGGIPITGAAGYTSFRARRRLGRRQLRRRLQRPEELFGR
jgi:hypothetical protein